MMEYHDLGFYFLNILWEHFCILTEFNEFLEFYELGAFCLG